MGKKVARAYILENLEYFAKCIAHVRDSRDKGGHTAIDLEDLQNAMMELPRKDRENIEHFWGLKGGINHSKKLASLKENDVAFIRMGEDAVKSLRILFKLDFLYKYDGKTKTMVNSLAKKIRKGDINVTDLEAIKYLEIFLVILQNGPKMSFEEDPMAVNTEVSEELTVDEYSVIQEALKELRNKPDKSINLDLIHNWLDMLDFKDTLAIKKSFCIQVHRDEIPKEFGDGRIEPMYTLAEIRSFKERNFDYGSWDVTSELILGNADTISHLEGFMKCLNTIRKDWSKIVDFKVGQKQLRTSTELRTLDVYNIGGLEFTDIYEVMFLYLERNHLAPETDD